MITSLKENEVFVFGSNLAGRHLAGAAFQAKEQFGAEDGVSEGLTGRCYAFPTLDKHLRRLPLWRLEEARDLFFETARQNPHLRFLMTKVGCGIAGYPENQMRSLFREAPANVVLPEDWQPTTQPMNILITITNDAGESVFRAETLSVDSAIQELGRFERHFLPSLIPSDEPELTGKEYAEQEANAHVHG
jgi:hypothetical protein